jgi:hypothetical protein
MADSRIPEIPLPRPFLRVVSEAPITKEDLERVRRTLQQNIDALQAELRREKELTAKLKKSAEVLQEILSAPDFRALSMRTQAIAVVEAQRPAAAFIDEPPVEYVEVQEIELTDQQVKSLETEASPKRKTAED